MKATLSKSTEGIFYGGYTVSQSSLRQPPCCIVFTGQGSNFPEMFSKYIHQFRHVDERFKEADKISHRLGLKKVSDYVLNPKNLTRNEKRDLENLALFTGQCALYDLVKERVKPTIISSHSFGEYAAAVAANITTFEEMFLFVWAREKCAPENNEAGYMVAAKSDRKRAEAALEGLDYYFCNENSHKQVVFSVKPELKMTARKRLRKNRIAALILDAPQPFHSPLLDDAHQKLSKYLQETPFNAKPPVTDIFSSVNRELISADNFNADIFSKIMTDQLIEPVMFIDQIKAISNLGCTRFLEIGPKPIVTRFIQEISRANRLDLSAQFVDKILLKHRKVVDKNRYTGRNSKTVALVNRIISKVTGYEIDSISLEDRFQDDLGIDSIKKAEVLFTVLSEMDKSIGSETNTSDLHRVVDLVDEVDSVKNTLSLSNRYSIPKQNFTTQRTEWIEKPLQRFFSTDESATVISDFGEISEAAAKTKKVIIKLNSPPADELLGAILMLKEQVDNLPQGTRLALLSQRKDHVAEGFGAFFKSLVKESSSLFFKHIRFDDYSDELIESSSYELDEPSEIDIFYDHLTRKTLITNTTTSSPPKIDKNTVFVIVGGAKGIAYSLVDGLSKKHSAIFHLCGRSTLEAESVSQNINKLKQTNKNIFYHAFDASNPEQTKALFESIAHQHDKIDFVINSTGVEHSKPLVQKDEAEIKSELKNKLDTAACISKYSPVKPIHFSSIVSLFGNAGQTVYALSNAIINSRAEAEGETSILWPPWDGVGMMNSHFTEAMRSRGLGLLTPEEALPLFESALSQKGVVIMHSEADTPLYESGLKDRAVISSAKITPKGRPWLVDHSINGTILLPAASAATMFLLGGYQHSKEFVAIADFEVKSAVIIGDAGVNLTTEFLKSTEGNHAQIYSSTVHFTAKLEQYEKRDMQSPLTCDGEKLSKIYGTNALFHGPHLQVIKSAGGSPDVWGKIDISCFDPTNNEQRLIPILDSAFQLLSLSAMGRGWSALPTSCKKIELNSDVELTETLQADARNLTFSEKNVTADIRIYNDKYQCILTLTGAVASRR